MCCDFGYGSVTISDVDGEVLWTHEGGYGAFHSVIIHVNDNDSIRVSDDQDTYVSPGAIATQSNLRKYSRDPEENDPLWPGVYPEVLNQMVVNVKLDMFPEVRTMHCELQIGACQTYLI